MPTPPSAHQPVSLVLPLEWVFSASMWDKPAPPALWWWEDGTNSNWEIAPPTFLRSPEVRSHWWRDYREKTASLSGSLNAGGGVLAGGTSRQKDRSGQEAVREVDLVLHGALHREASSCSLRRPPLHLGPC